MARLTRLELPDSNSSSLPKDLQLPGLAYITLFSLDNLQALASFAPNLQGIECFSLNFTPGGRHAPPGSMHAAAAPAAPTAAAVAAGVLASCRVLAAACIYIPAGCSVKAAAACLASATPGLKELAMVPEVVQQGGEAGAAQQLCEELTLRGLQQALPGLQLVARNMESCA
jgi:hypothetical protein